MAISLESRRSKPTASLARLPRLASFSLGKELRWPFGRTAKPAEVIFFTSQLSLMLEVGTSLSVSLKAIGEQTKNRAFKEVILAMHQDIEEGRQLSEAMKRHPSVFDQVFVSMIKAGETGGFLQKILDRLVEMQEKRQALLTQLRSTMTYPAVLCVMSVLVVSFILVVVLPKFTAFFQGKEDLLPVTTRFLMMLSASMKQYGWVYLLSAIGLAVGLKIFKDSEPGKILIDWSSLNVPVMARLCNKIYTCQLLRTLGYLMESQVPLLEALEVNRPVIPNRHYRRFVDQIADSVQQGGRFAQPFAVNPYILDSVKQMVAAGEEAGNLPKVMLRLAQFYDTEVDRELKALASMIEPMALIVMGAVIGLIVSSVILPMFKLSRVMM
jgi:type II secretory pathway component PulF